jgi:hypothetical protein
VTRRGKAHVSYAEDSLMALSESQYALLKTDIVVTNAAEFSAWVASNDDALIAAVYSQVAAPDFWVYRSAVSKEEIVGATSQEGTTFIWAGNGFIGRSAGEQAAWRELFSVYGVVNMSLPQVRQAFQDIFSGTANAASNRAHLAVVARRKALRIERLYATGTGAIGSPATLGPEGPISYLDIARALRGVGA